MIDPNNLPKIVWTIDYSELEKFKPTEVRSLGHHTFVFAKTLQFDIRNCYATKREAEKAWAECFKGQLENLLEHYGTSTSMTKEVKRILKEKSQ